LGGRVQQTPRPCDAASVIAREQNNRRNRGTVKRVHIPKAGSPDQTRPIGIPTLEDKVLQRAVMMLLEPIYEQDFIPGSYGFRPGRGAHQALEKLWKETMNTDGGWVLEVDISKFFDTLDHGHLRQFVQPPAATQTDLVSEKASLHPLLSTDGHRRRRWEGAASDYRSGTAAGGAIVGTLSD
jgi:hypothetical protein